MSFFVRYNGTTHAGLVRLETLAWVLIYGGLLGGLVGGWMLRTGQDGWALLVAGAIAVGIGLVLVYVRSRQPDASDPPSGPGGGRR